MIVSKFGLRDLVGTVPNITDGIPSTYWTFDNPSGLANNSWIQIDFGYNVNLLLFRLQKLAQGIGDFVVVCSDAPATNGSDAVQSGDFVTQVFRDSATGQPPNTPDLKFWSPADLYPSVWAPTIADSSSTGGSNPTPAAPEGTGVSAGSANTSYFTMPLLPKAFRYYRLMPAGTLGISAGVQLSEFLPIYSLAISQFGFSAPEPTSNMADGDLSTVWTPSHSSFASADSFPSDGSAVIFGGSHPYIQLDFGVSVALGMLLISQLPGALSPCRLIASGLPATDASNSVRNGDVEIARFSQAELDAGQFKATSLNVGGAQSFRYYRLVFEKNEGPSGAAIRDFSVFFPLNKTYVESDYDSIWGRGERSVNGLITSGWYGYNGIVTGAGSVDNIFDGSVTNNLTMAGGNTPAGASVWFDFGPWGLELHGFQFVDTTGGTFTTPVPVTLVGGLSPGAYFPASYTATVATFQWSQSALPATNEILFEPSQPFGWPHYEFVLPTAHTSMPSGAFIIGDLWLKIAHSNLDGGDRRNLGSTRPDKFVQVGIGPGIAVRTSGGVTDLGLPDLVDGSFFHNGSPTGSRSNGTHLIDATTGGVVNTVGRYIEFTFPRNVRMNHLILNTFSAQESYTGSAPDHWGVWHWEVSDDNVNFETVGGSWSFSPGVNYMLAPRQTANSPASTSTWIATSSYQTSSMLVSGNPPQTVTVHAAPSADGGQASAVEKKHGKLYLEATCSIAGVGGFGFTDGGKNLNFGSTPSHALTLNTDGKVYANDATAVATFTAFSGTHRWGWALDLDAALFWVRLDNGNWNNSPTANPATGVGGLNLRNAAWSWTLLSLWFWADTTGDTCTFNSLGPFTDVKPAGFAAWDQGYVSASQSGFNPPATGHPIWRMVLDSGSFGGSQTMIQFLFNLTDEGNQETGFRVSFSDDGPELTIPAISSFIGPPGNPFVVALSDNTTDGLTATISIVQAHVMRFDIDDGGDIEFVSRDLMPSQVVQTVTVITGS